VTTGALNTALGDVAGFDVSTGNNIIAIGAFQSGVDAALGQLDNSCYIGNIANQPISAVNFVGIVGVDTDGKLGTFTVDANGNNVPISSLLGTQHQAMFNRKVEKLQATVTQQQKQIETLTAQLKEQAAHQQKELAALTAGLQKVSAQLEMGSAKPRTLATNP
jgi:uncharacterized coiled-coil protein SlyX